MEILVAESAGFCYGVRRAVKMAQEAVKRADSAPIYTLGPIIHNPQVVKKLEESGIRAKERVKEIEQGVVVVRAHGVAKEELIEAKEKGLTLVDATCPYVRRVHTLAEKMIGEGYTVVMIGDQNHPEIRGVLGHVQEPDLVIVVQSPEEAERLEELGRVVVVTQTTQSWECFGKVVEVLLRKAGELRIFNTICDATTVRQMEALELAKMVDCMIIIGGYTSANTNRLTKICRQIQPNTHQIETPEELKGEWFQGVRRVGVTAGASTPREMVEELVERIAMSYGGALMPFNITERRQGEEI